MLRSRSLWRIAMVLAVLAGSIFLWWKHTLTPLERYYFWSYANCALQGDDPGSYSEIHWLYKTAPRRKQVFAADQDLVPADSIHGDSPSVRLSATARKEGWTGLIHGEDEWIEVRRLQPFLRQDFYDNQSLWRMLLNPLLWSVAVLLCLLIGEDVLRTRRETRWNRQHWARRQQWHIRVVHTSIKAIRSARFGVPKFIRKLARRSRTTPASEKPTTVVPPAVSTEPTAAAGLRLFGVRTETPAQAEIWSPQDRDRLM